MAVAPNKYIDNIRIGTTGDPAQVAAPYIVANYDKEGNPLTTPLFKNYWETDYTEVIPFPTPEREWQVNYDRIDKSTPSVTILDSGKNIIYANVTYDDANKKIIVNFGNSPVAGYVLIN